MRSIRDRLPPEQYAQLVRLGAVKPCSPRACAACGAPACPHRGGEDPIHIDLADVGELLPRGGLGDAGPAPFEVTAEEGAFLDEAKRRLVRIRDRAVAIGPKAFFRTYSSYGEFWGPVYDALAELLADARKHLEVGSPVMIEFNRGGTALLNLIFQIRETGVIDDFFNAVAAAFNGNPIMVLQWFQKQAAGAGSLVVDVGRAGVDVYGGWLGDFWRWLPGWARVAIPVVAVGGGALVARRVKKAVLG